MMIDFTIKLTFILFLWGTGMVVLARDNGGGWDFGRWK